MAVMSNGHLGPLLTKMAFGRPLNVWNAKRSVRNWSFPVEKFSPVERDWLAQFVDKQVSMDSLSHAVLYYLKEGSIGDSRLESFVPVLDDRLPKLLDSICQILLAVDAVVGFGAYGSVADNTWLRGSSDLDLIIMLDLDLIDNQHDFLELFEAIVEANRRVLQQDPLQHHGISVVVLRDIWPESIVPVEILDETKWYMLKVPVFQFQTPVNKLSYSSSLKKIVKIHINKLISLPFSLYNMYLAKVIFSSVVMLLIFLQEESLQNKMVKKDHLKIISQKSQGTDQDILKYATDFRNTLNYPLSKIAALNLINGNIVRLQLYIIIESYFLGGCSNKFKLEFLIKKKLKKLINEL